MKLHFPKGNSKIVVKVGSSILTANQNQIDKHILQFITSQICRLKKENIDVVLVSSGAIASGMRLLGYTQRPKSLGELQSTAAVGQTLLMHNYEKLFRKEGFLTAQILLTSEDLHNRIRYLNARNTILNLIEKNVIAIVNENDTVATDAIKFGDNDKLSSLVATLIDAKLLIILSDVDGLYDGRKTIIKKIDKIDSYILGLAQNTSRTTSVGGMVTKLDAAKIATNAGIPMVIANGMKKDTLLDIINKGEEIGTWFLPREDRILGKKRWIAFSCRSCGKIFVDDGAKEAILKKGRSLLASGIVGLEGKFAVGDLVLICDKKNIEIAKGLTNYSKDSLEKIKGMKTSEIEEILGYKLYDEVIHRNNLVILE